MSAHTKECLEVIRDAEKKLLQILSKYASMGDYEAIDFARNAASRTRQLIESLLSTTREMSAVSTPTRTPVRSPVEKSTKKKSSRRGKKKKRGMYPRFFIQDESLVKEGWSKKTKRTYTHRAGKDEYHKVVTALDKIAGEVNRPLSTEMLLAESGLQDTLPTYKFYVVLAFLREFGVIRQVGREGHVVPKGLLDNAIDLWNKIQSQSSSEG